MSDKKVLLINLNFYNMKVSKAILSKRPFYRGKMRVATILAIGLMTSIGYSQRATYEEVKNKEVKGKLDTYISKQGESFSVGDTLTIGKPINGQYTALSGNNNHANYIPGSKTIITKLYAFNRHIFVYSKRGDFKIFEKSLQHVLDNGEIESSIMTREQAIAKLMEAKDLLSIDMMTQEEYDKLKEKLSPIIKS